MKTIALILALLIHVASAAIVEEGVGIVYGSNHAFSFKAPKGWVLDNESGVGQGVHAVFYEKGGSWEKSKVVAYARAANRDGKVKTAADQVATTIAGFRKNGSDKYDGKKVKTVKNESGKEGEIYHFSGDKWGNFEAVAYFVEDKTINFVVLNSRDEKLFNDALPTFEELAKSYLFVGEKVDIQKPAPEKKPAPKKKAAAESK
jgi:hypothetical protein